MACCGFLYIYSDDGSTYSCNSKYIKALIKKELKSLRERGCIRLQRHPVLSLRSSISHFGWIFHNMLNVQITPNFSVTLELKFKIWVSFEKFEICWVKVENMVLFRLKYYVNIENRSSSVFSVGHSPNHKK